MLYYSQTGATKAVAEEIGKQLEAEVVAIEAEEPYDGDYPATIERWRQEKEAGVKVGIKPLPVNPEDYETIFLGFPVWGGTVASPVATFLADNSLKGKKIVTFATFGSGGLESSTADVAAAQPEAEVVKGYGVRNALVAKAPAEIERFLIENGFKEGTVTVLPDYGENEPVNEGEIEIFNQACGDYQFPLGTPVSVEKRSYEGIDDYKFTVKSQTPDGNETTATIYVVVAEGETPVFTRVVR
ncbi:MAG: hypothetical protein J1E38_08970 [Paramuribaculum sp.]|nr:hypothetical protein [Paramuribaculum sp.]